MLPKISVEVYVCFFNLKILARKSPYYIKQVYLNLQTYKLTKIGLHKCIITR